jgi:hypothetical protein
MGKEPHRVMKDGAARPAGKKAARVSPERVQRLESEIESSRRRLDAYVDELDRRRHRWLSIRRHPGPALGAAVGALALVAGTIVLLRRRSRLDRSRRKLENLQGAFARVFAHPERVASEGKSPWSRILVAVAPVAAKLVADAVLRRRR